MRSFRPTATIRFTVLFSLMVFLAIAMLPPTTPTSATASTIAPPSDFALHLSGRIEGQPSAFDLEDGILAAAGMSSLTLYDVTDPAQPRTLSMVTVPGMTQVVQLEAGFAYVGWGSCEMPDECGDRLDIYDLALPTAPLLVARVDAPNTIDNLVVMGDIAYATTSANGLYTIDLRTRSAPQFLPSTSPAVKGWIDALAVDERADRGGQPLGYLGRPYELQIIDLDTDRMLGRLDLTGIASSVDLVPFTTSDGRHLLYVAEETRGVHVIDVDDPTNPKILSTIDVWKPIRLDVSDDTLYVLSSGGGDIQIFDLSDPLAPHAAGTLPNIRSFILVARDGVLVVADRYAAIRIFVEAPAGALEEVGTIPLIQGAKAYHEGFVYVMDRVDGLLAIDLRRPAAPVLHRLGLPTGMAGTTLVTASGGYLVMVESIYTWKFFDLSDPLDPQLRSTLAAQTAGNQRPLMALIDPTAPTPYLYTLSACTNAVLTCGGRLELFDFSDPTQPKPRGTLTIESTGYTVDLSVRDGYAYIIMVDPAAGDNIRNAGWLYSIDVRNPDTPTLMGKVLVSGTPTDIALSGDRAYVTAWWGGLHTIDITDPNAPLLRSTYLSHREMQAYRVVADGAAVFVTTQYASEFYKLDLSEPTRPILVHRSKVPGTSEFLALDDDTLIAAGSGLVVYERGAAADGRVVDARGAPMSNVDLHLGDGNGLAAFTATATDLGGNLDVDRSRDTNALLTPAFRDHSFAPRNRIIGSSGALDFVMLGASVQAAVSPGISTTLTFTDTQGLTSRLHIADTTVSAAGTIIVQPTIAEHTDGLQFAGQAFTITLAGDGMQLNTPAILDVHYSRGDVRFISDHNRLALYRAEAGTWVPAESACGDNATSTHDLEARRITVAICTPGTYALLGPTNRLYLPMLGS